MRYSIIVPVYNASHYLRAALNTVLQQTYGDWECICVDDGSQDDSLSILHEFSRIDSRFIILTQSNAGVSSARNRGLDVARGDWIVFLDSDDGMRLNMLEALSKDLDDNVDMIKFGFVECDDVALESVSRPEEIVCKRYDLKEKSSAIRAFYLTGSLFAWNCCFRRNLIADSRFDTSLPIGEDGLFSFGLFLRASNFAMKDVGLYQYRRRLDSAVRTINAKNVKSGIDSFVALMDKARAWRYFNEVKHLLLKRLVNTYCGATYENILRLPLNEQGCVKKYFFKKGVLASSDFFAVSLIFRLRSQILFCSTLYWFYKLKVVMVKLRRRT